MLKELTEYIKYLAIIHTIDGQNTCQIVRAEALKNSEIMQITTNN